MTERPILFSGPMVRAILDGGKTQTRRVLKPQPRLRSDGWVWDESTDHGLLWAVGDVPLMGGYCPYGHPGDRLWVRENFWSDRRDPNVVIYDATPEWGKYKDEPEPTRSTFPDGGLPSREESQRNVETNKFWRRRPSIFMPRWASRITVEITAVRVQRLQEISDADARAEGTEALVRELGMGATTCCPLASYAPLTVAQRVFGMLWNSINEKRGFGWAANPWACALTFRRVEA